MSLRRLTPSGIKIKPRPLRIGRGEGKPPSWAQSNSPNTFGKATPLYRVWCCLRPVQEVLPRNFGRLDTPHPRSGCPSCPRLHSALTGWVNRAGYSFVAAVCSVGMVTTVTCGIMGGKRFCLERPQCGPVCGRNCACGFCSGQKQS